MHPTTKAIPVGCMHSAHPSPLSSWPFSVLCISYLCSLIPLKSRACPCPIPLKLPGLPGCSPAQKPVPLRQPGQALSQGPSVSWACFSPIQFVALADGDPSGTPAQGVLTIHSSGGLGHPGFFPLPVVLTPRVQATREEAKSCSRCSLSWPPKQRHPPPTHLGFL